MDSLLHDLMSAAALARPDAIAVVHEGRTITYADLDRASNRLANTLHDRGIRRGDRVGLYLEKSVDAVIGVYAILKTGAAYVPLDPAAPASRVAYIARNCGVRVLITGAEKAARWSELLADGAPITTLVVCNTDKVVDAPLPPQVTVLTHRDVQRSSESPLGVGAISLDLAYILYTSGSTGEPKGVKLTHRNALAFVEWAVETFDVRSDDRLSSHAPFHFDLSVFDLFAAAKAGATLILVPPETSLFPTAVRRFIEDNGITIWYSVPSILNLLTVRGDLKTGALPTLRTILFAGEVFPTKYLRRLMALLPGVRFSNLYGPTETNVCTWYDVPLLPDDMEEPIPIGRAIDDVEVFAVTEDGVRAHKGQVGELYVRGPTVMQGYWGDADRTARGLVPHPFDTELTDRAYRTGDLVEELDDGSYRFLGRRDSQIKSRGYRIELGDIEAALYAHPDVIECAVTAVPDDMVTNRIRAFVVVRNEVRESDLVRFCAARVPRYMVPESFEIRDALPKTSTGKVDRRALAGAAAS